MLGIYILVKYDCLSSLGFLKFQLGEPALHVESGFPVCHAHGDSPVYGDCWYNCTAEDISGSDRNLKNYPSILHIFFSIGEIILQGAQGMY